MLQRLRRLRKISSSEPELLQKRRHRRFQISDLKFQIQETTTPARTLMLMQPPTQMQLQNPRQMPRQIQKQKQKQMQMQMQMQMQIPHR